MTVYPIATPRTSVTWPEPLEPIWQMLRAGLVIENQGGDSL